MSTATAEAAATLTWPTTAQLLARLAAHLLHQGPGEFSEKWEMARHRCYMQIELRLSRAQFAERLEAQRASLAYLNRAA